MKTLAKRFVIAAMFAPATLYAQSEELPPGGVDVSMQFVSNYVWRGYDLYENYARQNNRAYGSASGAVAFQPSVTFATPVEGLYANIWASIAMQGRDDVDTDQLLQTGPGLSGNNADGAVQGVNLATLTRESGGAISVDTLLASYMTLMTTAGLDTLEKTATGVKAPGFYKEENGLKRSDEVDLTIGYERETSAGTIGFGFVTYIKPNPVNSTPSPSSEVFVTYGLPDALSFFSVGIFGDIELHTLYVPLTIEYQPEPFFFSLTAGYGVQPGLNNWQDVTAGVGVEIAGFNIGLYAVYRPHLAFFDPDTSVGRDVPAWLAGGSTRFDGLAPDPSRTNGMVNSDLNQLLTGALRPFAGSLYSYTPRQKIPRVLYYANIGYSFSI